MHPWDAEMFVDRSCIGLIFNSWLLWEFICLSGVSMACVSVTISPCITWLAYNWHLYSWFISHNSSPFFFWKMSRYKTESSELQNCKLTLLWRSHKLVKVQEQCFLTRNSSRHLIAISKESLEKGLWEMLIDRFFLKEKPWTLEVYQSWILASFLISAFLWTIFTLMFGGWVLYVLLYCG